MNMKVLMYLLNLTSNIMAYIDRWILIEFIIKMSLKCLGFFSVLKLLLLTIAFKLNIVRTMNVGNIYSL